MGFFESYEIDSAKNTSLLPTCDQCGMYKGLKHPKMGVTGEGKLKILLLGEASGKVEDEEGYQFCGEAGKLLKNEVLAPLGYSNDDFHFLNSVRCFVSPKVRVYTIDGYKKLGDIKVGDLVLTHKGRFRKVLSRTWDLPKQLTTNREDIFHIRIRKIGAHGTTHGGLRVSARHEFLTANGWVEIENLNVGDKIFTLGSNCLNCNAPIYKEYSQFEKTLDYCSTKCQMSYEYKTGIRTGDITQKANDRTRQLIKEGKHNLQSLSQDMIDKANRTKAKNRQKVNQVSQPAFNLVGYGEKEVGEYLSEQKIRYIHQYAIYQYNYDFYLPDYHLLIEIDNPQRLGQNVFEEKIKLKTTLAISLNYPIVRISSESPVESIKRLLKNHLGEYTFVEAEIGSIRKEKPNRKQRLYCIEVEEDNSFIAAGIVHHNCRPVTRDEKGERNRTPEDFEIQLCSTETWEIIKKLDINAIITLGRVPLQSYLQTNTAFGKEQPTMATWADWTIPDRRLGLWIIPQYHPSFFLRQMGTRNRGILNVYKKKIAQAIINAQLPFPDLTYEQKKIRILFDTNEIIRELRWIKEHKPKFIVIDWETTGLKPYRDGHKIVAVGIAWERESAISFPFSQDILPFLIPILTDPDIKKGAHNFKFEELWSRVILKTPIVGWKWCSQLATHVLDDRSGITSLEFQSFVRYGVDGFKSDTAKYMKAVNSNAFNTVESCPRDLLLIRNGMDVMMTFRLAQDQQKEMSNKLKSAYNFFHEGSLALLDAEMAGIRAPMEYFQKAQESIAGDCEEALARIKESHYTKVWRTKTNTELNPKSPDQLKKLLFEFLGIKPLKKTAKDNPTLDKNDLEKIAKQVKSPSLRAFLNDIASLRASSKTESTYMRGIMREILEDWLHPFFGLTNVRSYRGSSSNPNLQNVPVRNQKMMEIVRSGLYPHPGQQLLEIDYETHEIRISSIATQDPELLRYCQDPQSDMHTDQTRIIYLVDDKIINWLKDRRQWKAIRNTVKGAFVFAQFYGSWYDPCARNLWEASYELEFGDGFLIDHLKEKGFTDLQSFIDHVKEAEERLWDRFSVYAEWKEEWVQRYFKTGKVDLFLYPFRRQGILARNEIPNTSIQGTAFHCLLWALIEINKIAKKENWKSKIIGQIHDCILMSVEPSELKRVAQIVRWVMVDYIGKKFPFLTIPLAVEFELAGIDEPWSRKKTVAL